MAETSANAKSRLKIGLKISGGLVGLVVLNWVLLSFMTGFFAGLAATKLPYVFAIIAASVFVAPFNFVLFQRITNWW